MRSFPSVLGSWSPSRSLKITEHLTDGLKVDDESKAKDELKITVPLSLSSMVRPARLVLWLLLVCLMYSPCAWAGSWQIDRYICKGQTTLATSHSWQDSSYNPPYAEIYCGEAYTPPGSQSGTVQPVFYWASTNGDTAPAATLWIAVRGFATGGGSQGTADDGLGDPAVPSGDGSSVSSSGTHIVQQQVSAGQTSFTLPAYTVGAYTSADYSGYTGTGNSHPYVQLGATVITGPDFVVSDASCTINVGGQGTTTATITPINGFQGTVNLGTAQGSDSQSVSVSFTDLSSEANPISSVTLDGVHSVSVGVVATDIDPTTPSNVSLDLSLTGTSGSLTRNGTLNVLLFASRAVTPGPPPYGSGSSPTDGVGDDPVNLATGVDTYHQAPDLTVYNPNGPAAVFQRTAYSNLAQGPTSLTAPRPSCSPGLSAGWTHSYDVFIEGPFQFQQYSVGSGQAPPPVYRMALMYPGGTHEWIQLPKDSGPISAPTGAPYTVQATSTVNSASGAITWQSFTLTWDSGTKWQFTPVVSGSSGSVRQSYALTQITNRTGQGLTLAWNSLRQLTSVADSTSGRGLLFLSYDGSQQLSTVSDCYGRQVNYTFTNSLLSAVSQVAQGSAAAPARVSYGYAGILSFGVVSPLLDRVTAPSPTGTGSSTSTVTYDGTGMVTSFTDPNANQHAYVYGSGQTQVLVKSPTGVVCASWSEKYDALNRLTGTVDGAGHSDQIAYGDSRSPFKPTQVTDRNGNAVACTYDPFGHVTSLTDARSVTTTFTWDYSKFALGRLMKVQGGTNQPTPRTPVTLTYKEPSGLVLSITSAAPGSSAGGATVQSVFDYDALGNLLSASAPGNNASAANTTYFSYASDPGDAAHGVPAYSQAAAVGEPLAITDNLGHVTHLRYNSRGLLLSVFDALGHETDMGDATPAHGGGYNLADQPLLVTLPATGQTGSGHGTRTRTYLYPGGPLVGTAAFDESGGAVRHVTYSYGPDGETLGVTATDNSQPATYAYDALYRLKSFADGKGQATRFFYNPAGFLQSVLYPGGDTLQLPSYDADGNVLTRVDGRGVVTNYLYNDPESRLTDVTYPSSPGLNVHYGYDTYGRLVNKTDAATGQFAPGGTVATPGVVYGYDDAGLVSSVQTTFRSPAGSLLPANTLTYSYYPDGTRQGLSSPSGSFSYLRDAVGRLSSLSNPFSETSTWSFQDNGWLQGLTRADGAVSLYAFNPLGQLTDLLHRNQSGATLSEFAGMAYDGAGNRTAMTVSMPGTPGYGGTTSFGYDAKSQLVSEQSTRAGGYGRSNGYDAAGNPTTFRGVASGFNVNNQNSAFTFDKNGNPIGYQGVPLTFDAENHLLTSGH